MSRVQRPAGRVAGEPAPPAGDVAQAAAGEPPAVPGAAAPTVAAAAGITFREAHREDVPAIVRLLAEDELGSRRELAADPLPASYYAAFEAIEGDPNNELLVACRGGEVVGTMQLTFTPSLSYRGGWRATVESVRTAAALRRQGIGAAFMEWAVARARSRGCRLVQLSTHRTRLDAHRFYERLGFSASHVGMKLEL